MGKKAKVQNRARRAERARTEALVRESEEVERDRRRRERVLEQLEYASRAVDSHARQRDRLVLAARADGVGWFTIARIIGMTPRGAQKRYQDQVEDDAE